MQNKYARWCRISGMLDEDGSHMQKQQLRKSPPDLTVEVGVCMQTQEQELQPRERVGAVEGDRRGYATMTRPMGEII